MPFVKEIYAADLHAKCLSGKSNSQRQRVYAPICVSIGILKQTQVKHEDVFRSSLLSLFTVGVILCFFVMLFVA